VFEYMACEKPVIGAVVGETAMVLEESGGGIVVPPGDAHRIARAIMSLQDDPERCINMGKAGRAHVEKYYSRNTWAAKFEKLLVNRTGASTTLDRHIFAHEAE
jgi:glycosyltransferase involved in cell wall biosynthesis